jgi:hypothetical protein
MIKTAYVYAPDGTLYCYTVGEAGVTLIQVLDDRLIIHGEDDIAFIWANTPFRCKCTQSGLASDKPLPLVSLRDSGRYFIDFPIGHLFRVEADGNVKTVKVEEAEIEADRCFQCALNGCKCGGIGCSAPDRRDRKAVCYKEVE